MITTTTPHTWLRRSDQAVTWARTMLSPHRAVVIDCETTDLPGGDVCVPPTFQTPPISFSTQARLTHEVEPARRSWTMSCRSGRSSPRRS